MNRFIATLITLMLVGIGYVNAQNTLNLYQSDSSSYDALQDSLSITLKTRKYEKAYSFVINLNQRDSLSIETLSNCADCYIYLGKYDECIAFCDMWQSRCHDNAYNMFFLKIRGECHYYKKEYEQAFAYFEEYRGLLNEDGRNLSPYYISLYADMCHGMYKYAEAEK